MADQLTLMQRHPNYVLPEPLNGEDHFAFAMRAAGLLISPPQRDGESLEIECVDIQAALLLYADLLRRIWYEHQLKQELAIIVRDTNPARTWPTR